MDNSKVKVFMKSELGRSIVAVKDIKKSEIIAESKNYSKLLP